MYLQADGLLARMNIIVHLSYYIVFYVHMLVKTGYYQWCISGKLTLQQRMNVTN
jgi:hypothetical protein